MYECFAGVCVYIYTICVPGAHRDQKTISDPQELELDVVVMLHVGAGN